MKKKSSTPEEKLMDKISSDAEKKIDARKKGKEIMFGLGIFGIVGFSIAIPTLLGILLGSYLDGKTESSISFTMTFLFLGLVIGCINAWRWVKETSEGKK
ncbi:AtpZ/AtpI family protein [Proteiniclasticum sp. SCR006]|uniref:AtpZ/AtpI family protein n=1 Tax=Proteiniclasticum aestuarii TaxID=2817862 RepID=A0A939KJV3_9CLOT|nr:AtpZ/AtpI family protein [Proteiniclasticum aestuarii]